MNRKQLCYLFLLLAISLASGCGEYELLEYQKECKRSADSLYKVHRDSLTKKAEKICQLEYDSIYALTLDSLKQAKRSDIIKLIKE